MAKLVAALAALVAASVPMLLGRSYEGRPIDAIRAGDPHGPRVLIVGCIHGTECAGIAVARALERVRTRADLWIVPNLNPDGYTQGRRQNARGVDLNTNWSSGWRGGGRPWDVYYPGPRPFSERETRIARNLILRIHPRRLGVPHGRAACGEPLAAAGAPPGARGPAARRGDRLAARLRDRRAVQRPPRGSARLVIARARGRHLEEQAGVASS